MKKKLIVAGTVGGVILLTGVTVFAVKQNSGERVKVISMQEMMGYGGGMYNTSLSGNITSDVSQDVYLGMNQVVDEIFVEEGQTVSVGDELISYDMTLVNLEMEMKKLDREGIELNIKKAQREIKKLRNTKPADNGGGGMTDPGFDSNPVVPDPDIPEDPVEEPTAALAELNQDSKPYMGEGTEQNPYHFLCSQKGVIRGSFLNKMAEQKCFFLIEVRESDLSNGALMKVWGQKISEKDFHVEPDMKYEMKLGEYEEDEEIVNRPAFSELIGTDVEKKLWCRGDGSQENPYVFLVKPDGIVRGSFFNQMKKLGGYFRIEVREDNVYGGILLKAWEQQAEKLEDLEDDEAYLVGLVKTVVTPTPDPENPTPTPDPENPDPTPTTEPGPTVEPTAEPTPTTEPGPTAEPTAEPTPTVTPSVTPDPEAQPGELSADAFAGQMTSSALQVRTMQVNSVEDVMDFGDGGMMSKEEIQNQIKEKEKEIRDYQLDLKEADLELNRIQKELNNQTIKSTLNGVVKTVGDPEKENTDGTPLIQVVSSEGLYIQGTISEMQLDDLKEGQMLNGFSYDTGVSFTAEVREISPYPVEGQYYGGANSSMYPFTAYIQNAEGLKNYSYAELTMTEEDGSSAGGGMVIEKAFVRTEDGQYYVMIDDGKGRLKKQVVQIARVIYGSMYEISDGLTYEDKIAFPYGKNVKEGARTEDGTLQDLYR